MEFNPQKCQILRVTNKRTPINCKYTIHEQELEETSNAKYLGVTFNNKMSWNTHINAICTKANNTMNFLQRNFSRSHCKTKELLYKAYARPIPEYGGSVWDPYTQCNINRLESVQRRAARFCTGTFSREERVTPLLQNLKWEPLRERRAKTKMIIWYKAG